MNKNLFILSLAFLVPFLPFSSVFSEDRVNQSIGIVIDKKSPNYNVERILKKVILSVSSSNRNVRLYSSDSADLEYTGIKELNGNVLIKTVKKSGNYQIELYSLDTKTNRFDNSIQMSLKDFGDRVDDIALQVASNISLQYPPKPLRELTKIDIIKIKLSEYESQEGFWSLSVIPAWGLMNISTGFFASMSDSRELHFSCNGADGNVEATYRLQQWNFMISAGGGMGWGNNKDYQGSFYNFYASGMAGYGIFGSLIILGLEPTYYYGQFKNNMTTVLNTQTVPFPDLTVQLIQFNMFIQVNISKDYYITFSAGPPLPLDFFTDIWIDFNKNGAYPDYLMVKAPALYANGMPMIKIRFNFRLFSSWNMQLMYDSGGPSFEGDTVAVDDAKKPIPSSVVMGNLFLKRINMNKTRIGLGIQYEF